MRLVYPLVALAVAVVLGLRSGDDQWLAIGALVLAAATSALDGRAGAALALLLCLVALGSVVLQSLILLVGDAGPPQSCGTACMERQLGYERLAHERFIDAAILVIPVIASVILLGARWSDRVKTA